MLCVNSLPKSADLTRVLAPLPVSFGRHRSLMMIRLIYCTATISLFDTLCRLSECLIRRDVFLYALSCMFTLLADRNADTRTFVNNFYTNLLGKRVN